MTRKREQLEEHTYTPPLPASRAIETDVYQAIAERLWGIGCQLNHLADLLTAYGWQGQGAQVRGPAREAQMQARAMAGNTMGKLPEAWDVEQTYWHRRTLDRLRVVW